MLLPCKKAVAELLGKSQDEIRIGYASTIGDLFHAGHIAYLREAKNYCDYLIVGLVDDPTIDRSWKNKPVQSLLERYIQIASCEYADCVIPLSGEQDLRDSLLLLQPDVRFVGEEYKSTSFTGDDIKGIEIVYLPRQHSFSSSDLRCRAYAAENERLASEHKKAVNSIASDTKSVQDIIEHNENMLNKVHTIASDADTLDDYSDIGKQDY